MANKLTSTEPLYVRLDAVLPQTQCRQCGYDGCQAYAEALAQQQAAANRCPPGGETVARRLSTLLDRPYQPVDETLGEVSPPRKVAFIVAPDCIGCTLCIQACPVDAIVGAAKHLHTVVETECTGCGLCVAPCPTDCIVLKPPLTLEPVPAAAWSEAQRHYFRQRDKRRRSRRAQQHQAQEAKRAALLLGLTASQQASGPSSVVEAALARARHPPTEAPIQPAVPDPNLPPKAH